MGLTVKPKPVGIYGTLLRVYPQSFRDHYGPTMMQTFDDMLTNERSGLGRLRIWAITLIDMPFSATKEHITNGGGMNMNRNFKLLLGAGLLAIVIVGLASFWEGNLHSRSTIVVERVTDAQLADAMQQDDFYSTYGDTAVLFSGKVASVKVKDNASLVTFNTGRLYNVVCQFPRAVSYKIGQTISVAAPAGSGEREAHGVLLHDCIDN